jgi:hypothetical protein
MPPRKNMPVFHFPSLTRLHRRLGAAGLAIGMAISMNGAYGQAKRLPSIADPDAAALTDRAEKDLAHAIEADSALFDSGLGTSCPLGHEDIVRATLGPLAYARMAQQLKAEPPPEISRLTVLSGTCPLNAIFNGPVEYITETGSRFATDSLVITTETKQRVAGVFVNGNPIGDHVTHRRLLSTTFNRLGSGELIEVKTGHPNRPVHSVAYESRDSDSRPTRPTVTFSWIDGPTMRTMTIIARTLDGDRTVSDMYQDDKLASRTRFKNHQLHGWNENFLPELVKLGMGKQCYQNGQEIKAVDCPDT